MRSPLVTVALSGARLCGRLSGPGTLNISAASAGRSLHYLWNQARISPYQSRSIHQDRNEDETPEAQSESSASTRNLFLGSLDDFKKYFNFPRPSPKEAFKLGKVVTIWGFLGKRRDVSSKLSFVNLLLDEAPEFQFVSSWAEPESPEQEIHVKLKSTPSWTPVCLTGKITKTEYGPTAVRGGYPREFSSYEISLQDIRVLNQFPKDIIVSEGARFPPSARNLQLRFSQPLRNRIKLRDALMQSVSGYLHSKGWTQIETPILFKSTPEGAREFLVPTRRAGYAYALPQSPQQYKQILMSSGFRGYYQFARCFRDEDLRADRQPEFTQLDMEMAFATGEDVMTRVEFLLDKIFHDLAIFWRLMAVDGEIFPVQKNYAMTPPEAFRYPLFCPERRNGFLKGLGPLFPRISYQDAMSLYGSDKPDMRISNKIQRIDSIVPKDFVEKISRLEKPIVEACKFRLQGTIDEVQKFVEKFFDTLPTILGGNPEGEPGVMIFQPGLPLSGLAALGPEFVSMITSPGDPKTRELGDLEPGDVLIVQAREDKPFMGEGSTVLGTVRRVFYQAAVDAGLLKRDLSFRFLWVTDFPLFTPNAEGSPEPGQGGSAGFSSTHHPFTAPLTDRDFELLATDPLRAKADHYDLVVNGVEVGGGSRRIHVAAVQEFVFREILRMSDEGVSHFGHLLEALRAGCPPHAGFAFGWDRLVSLLGYAESVRDVIAFPKSMKGEEPMTKSPGKITEEDLGVYHLAFARKNSGAPTEEAEPEEAKTEEA